jgi:hypothetical protein
LGGFVVDFGECAFGFADMFFIDGFVVGKVVVEIVEEVEVVVEIFRFPGFAIL